MRKLLLLLFLLIPGIVSAQVFSQNQIIRSPFGSNGFIVSTSTATGSKLSATSTPYFSNFFSGNGSINNLIVGTCTGCGGGSSSMQEPFPGNATTSLLSFTNGVIPFALQRSTGPNPIAIDIENSIFHDASGVGTPSLDWQNRQLFNNNGAGIFEWTGDNVALLNSSNSSFYALLDTLSLTGPHTLTIPNADGTIALSGANLSTFTNDVPFLTSLAGAASSTLLGDTNTWGGLNTFGNLTVTGTCTGCGSGSSISPYEIATTSTISIPQLAYFTQTGGRTTLGGVGTSTLSASSPLTGSFTQVGTGGALGIQVASAAQNGYMSSTMYSKLYAATTTFSAPLSYSLATNAVTCSTCLTAISGTWPITVSGSAISFGGLSTTSAAVVGGLPYWTGVNTFGTVATTSETCTAPLSCTAHVVLTGGGAITISTAGTWSGNAGSATDLTSRGAGVYANAATGIPTMIATSTLFGGTTPGFVWSYQNGAWGAYATSSTAGGGMSSLSGAVTGSGSGAVVTAFGSQNAGVLGSSIVGIPSMLATSTLYGAASVGGYVLQWSNATNGLVLAATSTSAGGGITALTGVVTAAGSGSVVTSYGSQAPGVLGNATTGNTAPMATSSLFGLGVTGGYVLGYSNATNSWIPMATSSASGAPGSNYFTNSGIYTYLSTGTNLGVGTTTPWSDLSVQGVGGGTNPLFTAASSSVTQLFQIGSDGSLAMSNPATGNKVDYDSDLQFIPSITTAAYLATYSDDFTRMLMCGTAAGSNIQLRNSGFAQAAQEYQGTTAQTVTWTTLYNALVVGRGCLTYKGYHYVMIASTTGYLIQGVVKVATSTDTNNIAALNAWATTTVSGTAIPAAAFLVGAANGNLYIATTTIGMQAYSITVGATAITLTASTYIPLAGANILLTNTRVNDSGIYVGFGAAPFTRKYTLAGAAVSGITNVGFAVPGTAGPDMFASQHSLYGLYGNSTTLLTQLVGY